MKLSEDLRWRGLIKDKTFTSDEFLDKPQTFYLGVDVGSADSMTIGNLAVLLAARRLLEAGWKTVLLVGGATSLIGDPGGKNEERQLVSRETVEHNKKCIRAQVERLFAGQKFELVDNYDWFKEIGYLEFLREVGKQFSMTELIQRDYIAERMGEGSAGISYAEFSYSLIQGYDFWHLNKTKGVVMQLGGSDQWGNMLSGVPLIRKKESVEAHALSIPLVVDRNTGHKFGKSEAGAVWLDDKKTSVFQFYQFWLNVGDDAVAELLKIYTMLDQKEIGQILKEFEADRSGRLAQRRLAFEVTAIVHGEDRAASAERLSGVLFGSADYHGLKTADFELMSAELPLLDGSAGSPIIELLVDAGLAASRTEARRFLDDGAVYVNGSQISISKTELEAADALEGGYIVLRRGKNSTALVKLK